MEEIKLTEEQKLEILRINQGYTEKGYYLKLVDQLKDYKFSNELIEQAYKEIEEKFSYLLVSYSFHNNKKTMEKAKEFMETIRLKNNKKYENQPT